MTARPVQELDSVALITVTFGVCLASNIEKTVQTVVFDILTITSYLLYRYNQLTLSDSPNAAVRGSSLAIDVST